MYTKDELNCLEKSMNIIKNKVGNLLTVIKGGNAPDVTYMDLQDLNSIIIKLATVVRVGNYELLNNSIPTFKIEPTKEIDIAVNYFIDNGLHSLFFAQILEMNSSKHLLYSCINIKQIEQTITNRILGLKEMYEHGVNTHEFKNAEYTYHELKTSMLNLLEFVQSFKYPNGVATNMENNNE